MEANKIIITGGATRIGAAIARKLSGSGVEIVIHYNKSKSNAEKLKKELSRNSTKVYLVKGDLSKEPDLKKIVKFCKRKLKYFDCLINNASLFENDKLENFTIDSWEKHLRTNLRAPAYLSKEFAKNIWNLYWRFSWIYNFNGDSRICWYAGENNRNLFRSIYCEYLCNYWLSIKNTSIGCVLRSWKTSSNSI